MSHFTVLVVGENPQKQLAPFQESLETHFKDCTEEVREKWESGTRKEFYCDSIYSWGLQITKELHDKFSSEKPGFRTSYIIPENMDMSWRIKQGGNFRVYYMGEDGKKYQKDSTNNDNFWMKIISIIPNGQLLVELIDEPNEYPIKDDFQSMDELAKDWFEYEEKDGKYGYWHNPIAKWDWHSLGGRWCGFFKPKKESLELSEKQTARKVGSHYAREATPGNFDAMYKKYIDFEQMKKDAYQKALDHYIKVTKIFAPSFKIPKLDYHWANDIVPLFYPENGEKAKMTKDEARALYNSQPAMVLLDTIKKNEKLPQEQRDILSPFFKLEEYQFTAEEYAQKEADSCYCTFAVLKDGEWYERGEMGWFAAVSNEKKEGEWVDEFKRLLDSVDDDTLLSIYDCHI